MYSAKDDLGTSYYFRGAVDNNWVKYGKYTKDMYNCNNGTISATDTGNSCTKIASSGDDIYWRIIRINGDGSIRMIYSGVKAPTESTKVIKTEDTSLGVTVFNANTDSSEYVGYMYTLGQQHGTSKSSDIKTYLDNWYTKYFNENIGTSRFVKTTFCNDRNTSRTWASNGRDFEYAPYTRLSSSPPTPTFECNNADVVTNNLGLITEDEIVLAGGKIGTDNSAFYLNNNMAYWAGSPCDFYVGSDAYVFYVDVGGRLYIGDVITGVGSVV